MTTSAPTLRASRITHRPPRHPWTSADPDGTTIAHVPLRNGEVAMLYADDYNALMSAGWPDQWFLKDNGRGYRYVAAGPEARTVSRAIVEEEGPGEVKYRDDNRLNLRRDNLYRAKREVPNAAAQVAEDAKF